LGIGDWGLGPIPNPQSPIPNPHITGIFLLQCILFNLIKNRKFHWILIYFNYIIVVIPLFHFRTILYKQGLIEENLYAMIRTFELLERIILILLNLASGPNAYLMNFLLTLALWVYTPYVTGYLGIMPYISAAIVLTILSYFYKKQVKLIFFKDYIMRKQNKWYLNLLDHMNCGFISSSTKNIIFMNRNLMNLIQSIIDKNIKNFQDNQSDQFTINKDDVSSIFEEIKINNYLKDQNENVSQVPYTEIHNKNVDLLAKQILTLLLKNIKKNDTTNSNCTYFNLNEFMEEMKKLYFNTNYDQTFIFIGYTDFIIEKELENLNIQKNIKEVSNYEVFMRCKFKETNNNSKILNSILIGGDEEFEFIFMDITNTKISERKNAELKYKTKFLSKIEHEFKNPLISIVELTEQLTNNNSNPSDQGVTNSNYLKQIKSFCNYLLILIKDLNYFSLSNFGIETKLESSETNLNEILNFCQDMAEILLIKYNKSEVKFKINKNFQGAFRFMIDGTKLIQVLVNLISNSVKFTHKGVIDVIVNYLVTSSNEQFLEFQIKDTGIGISPERIKEIYNKALISDNYDVDLNDSDFCIGINFVNEILQRFNSELKIESNSEGSTFSFSIKIEKIHHEEEYSSFNLKNNKFIPFKEFISNNDDEESISTRKLSSWEINLDVEIRQGIPSIDENNEIENNKILTINNNLNFIYSPFSKKWTRHKTNEKDSEISDLSLNLNTKFLIVVDDETLTRRSTTRILTRTLESMTQYNSDFNPDNIRILESEDGIQCLYLAFNLLKKGYKNITIISDENMSYMNGSTCAEVLKKLKNLNVNQIKFILLSAYNEIKNEFLDHFISKPLSASEALKIISIFVGL
jgi:signal transduction histidine kinase